MRELSEYHATDRDAAEYQTKVIVFNLGLYTCFAAFVLEVINVWWMVALSSVMVTRWMIAFHELLHLRSADELDPFTRLLPIPFAPLNIGYREYRNIHAGHHRDTATERDPDAFHILGDT
jgi:fatty acid desaturase